jgi:hypothetical protein
MLDNPLADGRMPEVLGRIFGKYVMLSEAYPEAAGTTEPPVIFGPDKAPPFDITTSTVHNVACGEAILGEPCSVTLPNSCDAVLNDAIVTDVLGHYRRNAIGDVVRGVKLTPKRSRLHIAPASSSNLSKRYGFPVLGEDLKRCINH